MDRLPIAKWQIVEREYSARLNRRISFVRLHEPQTIGSPRQPQRRSSAADPLQSLPQPIGGEEQRDAGDRT